MIKRNNINSKHSTYFKNTSLLFVYTRPVKSWGLYRKRAWAPILMICTYRTPILINGIYRLWMFLIYRGIILRSKRCQIFISVGLYCTNSLEAWNVGIVDTEVYRPLLISVFQRDTQGSFFLTSWLGHPSNIGTLYKFYLNSLIILKNIIEH